MQRSRFALGSAAVAIGLLAAPAHANLVLYSSMDNADIAAPTVHDLAGTPQNGTIIGTVGTGAAGHAGEAISIDAANSYVSYGDPESDGEDAFDPIHGDLTVSVWFKPAALDTIQYILSKGNTASSGAEGYSLFIEPIAGGHRLWTRLSSQGNADNDSRAGHYIDNTLSTNTWHHLVMVIDHATNTVTGYLNGSSAGFTSNAWGNTFAEDAIDTGNPLLVGGRVQSGLTFTGDIDEVAIFKSALNASEVQDLYQNGVPEPATAGLLGLGLLLGYRRGASTGQ